MSDKKFKRVDIADYFKQGFESGNIKLRKVKKISKIEARIGIYKERIKTIMANGLKETVNIVDVDKKTGELDNVITNPAKEQYIINHQIFHKKYKKDPKHPNKYASRGLINLAARINEDIVFKAPWGKDMYLEKGGYIIINSKTDIYGIQEQEFKNTYKFIKSNAKGD